MVRGVSLGAEALDPLAESVVVVFVLEVQVQGVSLVGELLGLVGQVIVRWAAPASGPVVVGIRSDLSALGGIVVGLRADLPSLGGSKE
jgi:hypothetical protein